MDEKNHKNHVFWIMGPSSSGKTTLSKEILKKFHKYGELAIHYDGDEVRDFFGSEFGFASNDRLRVVKTLVHLANKAFDCGFNSASYFSKCFFKKYHILPSNYQANC